MACLCISNPTSLPPLLLSQLRREYELAIERANTLQTELHCELMPEVLFSLTMTFHGTYTTSPPPPLPGSVPGSADSEHTGSEHGVSGPQCPPDL